MISIFVRNAGGGIELISGSKEVTFSTKADSPDNSEVIDEHISMRITKNEIIAHQKIQAAKINYPSDTRIKTNIADVDEDEILSRISKLTVKSY